MEEPVVVLGAHHLGTEAAANGAVGAVDRATDAAGDDAMVVPLVFHFSRPHSLLITGGLRTSELVFFTLRYKMSDSNNDSSKVQNKYFEISR